VSFDLIFFYGEEPFEFKNPEDSLNGSRLLLLADERELLEIRVVSS